MINTLKKLLFALMLAGIFKIQAQTISHESISSVKVSYLSAPSQTVSPGNLPVLRGTPQVKVALEPEVSSVKVYFRIIDPVGNNVIYQSDHILSSPAVNNQSGKKIFENTGTIVFLSNGSALPVKPYRYELQTEDNTGKLTTIHTTLQ